MLTKKQKAYLILKRAIDIFGALLGIILLSPLLLILAILTKATSSGPVFFRQKRLGKNEKPFTLLKFRSMRTDAKQIPPDEMTVEEQQAMVTGWGKFIRKTSLDELPQLFNIFAGQMSFIGPRPSQDAEHEGELVYERNSYIPSAYLVKPGLSGLSQVYLRRDHNYKSKAFWDSQYVQHLGFWLDFKIFILSFLCLFGYEKGR
jgi:lipopolysaccharide/colanic/teichoic acid biosynthesis glycosyltransferase